MHTAIRTALFLGLCLFTVTASAEETCTNSDTSKCVSYFDDCCVARKNPEPHSCSDGYTLVETTSNCKGSDNDGLRDFSCIKPGEDCKHDGWVIILIIVLILVCSIAGCVICGCCCCRSTQQTGVILQQQPGAVVVQQPVGFVQQPVGFVQQPVGFVQQPVGFVQQPVGFVQQPATTAMVGGVAMVGGAQMTQPQSYPAAQPMYVQQQQGYPQQQGAQMCQPQTYPVAEPQQQQPYPEKTE